MKRTFIQPNIFSDLQSGTKKKDNRSLMCFVVIANPSNGQVKLLGATYIYLNTVLVLTCAI